MKKAIFTSSLVFILAVSFAPVIVRAQSLPVCPGAVTTNPDADSDGYVGTSTSQNGYTGPIAPATNVNPGDQCIVGSNIYKYGDCFDKSGGTVDDKDGNKIRARDVHPGAINVPANGVDEDCSGSDASYGANTSVTANDVLNNIRNFLTWIVGGISGIVLIIGGIMYAVAAGDEQKTKKARKAMLGAVIGLVVAILANVIISIVTQNIAR